MEIIDSKDGGSSATFKAIGGEMDIFFFQGPTYKRVVEQYHKLVGRPALTPYYTAGFIYEFGSEDVKINKATLTKIMESGLSPSALSYRKDLTSNTTNLDIDASLK